MCWRDDGRNFAPVSMRSHDQHRNGRRWCLAASRDEAQAALVCDLLFLLLGLEERIRFLPNSALHTFFHVFTNALEIRSVFYNEVGGLCPAVRFFDLSHGYEEVDINDSTGSRIVITSLTPELAKNEALRLSHELGLELSYDELRLAAYLFMAAVENEKKPVQNP